MRSHLSFSQFEASLREFISRSTSERDSRATREAFRTLALQLFELQFHHNEIYRRLCLKFGTRPGEVEDWHELPGIPTRLFKEMDVTCLSPADRSTVFYSSGTTGHSPSRHYHNGASLDLYGTSVKAWFEPHLLGDLGAEEEGPGAPFGGNPMTGLILAPRHDQAPNSSLVWMFEAIRRWRGWPENSFLGGTGPGGEWTINEFRVIEAVEKAVTAGKPLILLGTSLLFAQLVERMVETKLNYRLPAGSRLMHTGGYKGRSRKIAPDRMLNWFKEVFGLPSRAIVAEYGMSELSSQAYTHPAQDSGSIQQGQTFQFPPWASVQVVSPETGREIDDEEKGLLRICDLANVYSAMMIQTEDMVIRRGGGFELLGRAEGSEVRGCSLMSL